MLVDTHCHLDWNAFEADRDEVIKRAIDSGVTRLFLMGAMNWTSQWYRPDGKLTPRKIARQFVDFVLGPAGKGG